LTAIVVAFAAIVPAVVPAQSTVVRVRVTDTARAPLPDADVAVVRNGTEPVALGRTNGDGMYSFRLDADTASYQVFARRLGFAPVSRDLVVARRDTVSLEIVLTGVAQTVDVVRIAERALPRAKQPFLDAGEIARDDRSILSLADALAVLRPDIGYQSSRCVSGPRPRGPVARGLIPSKRRTTRPPTQARVYVNGRWVPPEWDPWNSVSSDHIAEIRYVNCNDTSIPGLPPVPWASVYVVLKPGFVWDLKNGSHATPYVP